MLPLSDPRRLARRRLAALARQVPEAARGSVVGVHQSRVASRRLREFLPLCAEASGGDGTARKLASRVRRLTRGLGAARELDVSRLVLDKFCKRLPAHRAAGEAVRATLDQARATASTDMSTAIGSVDLDKLTRRTMALVSGLATPVARRRVGAALAARLNDRAATLREAVLAAGSLYAADRLHQVRIAAKKYRYTLELAQEFGRMRLTGTLRRLKRLQDLLGALHDLEVLAAHVRDSAAAAGPTEREALDALARDLDVEVRLRHGRYLGERESLDTVFAWGAHAAKRLTAPRPRPKPAAASRRTRATAARRTRRPTIERRRS